MSEGSQVSAGPDGPLLGNGRDDVTIPKLDQSFDRFERDTGVARSERQKLDEQSEAGLTFRDDVADSDSMGDDVIELELFHLRGLDARLTERTESGVDAIDVPIFGCFFEHEACSRGDGSARSWCQSQRGLLIDQPPQILKGVEIQCDLMFGGGHAAPSRRRSRVERPLFLTRRDISDEGLVRHI